MGRTMSGAFGYKDLLVSIDPSIEGRQRARFAMRLAGRHGASLIGYYAAPTVGQYLAAALSEDASRKAGRGAARPAVQAVDAADAMAEQFEDELKRRHLDGTWLLSGEDPAQDIARRARTADLCILGLGNPDPGVPDPQGFRPDEVILSCGRPVLGLPVANLPDEVGRQVLVAWDGSREASRALNDALPLILGAKSVTVLSVDPDEAMWESTQAAAGHLRRHGVAATPHKIPGAGMGIGDVILAHCDYLDADLVVAGAYGHSRLREAALGGVSRTLLRQMMVPVLMSH